MPALLREATFRSFNKNIWLVGQTTSQEQLPDIEGTTWALEQFPAEGSRTVRIAHSLIRGRGLLPVPRGTFQIEDLPVETLERHLLGALTVSRGPGLVRYTARYAPGRDFELPPGPEDLVVSRELKPLMAKVTADLDLEGASPFVALRKLSRFFLTEFEYSVVLRRPKLMATPLHEFLLKTRKGHCEFFASATVLLLRSLGVPARYATGYSVQEYSELEKAYVVRRRHAHSWALAYVNGQWIDFDTTPPVWGALEADAASWWEGGYDVVSWLIFQYSRWRWGEEDEESSSNALWIVALLVLVLIWRLAKTQRITRGRGGKPQKRPSVRRPGTDSELYALVKALEKRGLPRAPGEPLGSWLRRLAKRHDAAGVDEILGKILPVHYRYRFDPRGITAAERAALGRSVRDWLSRHAA